MDTAMSLGIILTLRDMASNQIDKIRANLQGMGKDGEEALRTLDNGAKMMVSGFGLLYGGVKLLGAAFSAPIQKAIQFESVMADVNKVANFTTQQYGEMSQSLIDMSKVIPMSASGLGEIMANAAQAGIAIEDLTDFTRDAAQMGVAFGIAAGEAGDVMAGLRSIFQLSQKDVVLLGDSVNQLSNSMNATAPNILEFLNRTGGIGRMAGMTGQQVAALGAAFIDLKTPPEVASRAISALVMKMTGASKSSKDALASFKSLGMSATEWEKLFKQDATLAIQTFLHAVKGAKDPISTLRSIVGEGFADDLAKLAGGADRLDFALSKVGNTSDYAGSMLAEYKARSQTVDNALLLLSNRFDAVQLKLGNILLPIFGKIVDAISTLVLWVSNLPEPIYVVIAAITGAAGALAILIGTMLLFKGATMIWGLFKTQAVSALRAFGIQANLAGISMKGMLVPALKFYALAEAAGWAWRNNLFGIRSGFANLAAGFEMAMSANENGIGEFTAEQVKALEDAGGSFESAEVVGAVFFRFRKLWDGVKTGAKEAADAITNAFTFADDFFEPITKPISTLLRHLGLIAENVMGATDTWGKWGTVIGRIAGSLAVVWVVLKGLAIISGITIAVRTLAGVLWMLAMNPVGAAIALVALSLWGLYEMLNALNGLTPTKPPETYTENSYLGGYTGGGNVTQPVSGYGAMSFKPKNTAEQKTIAPLATNLTEEKSSNTASMPTYREMSFDPNKMFENIKDFMSGDMFKDYQNMLNVSALNDSPHRPLSDDISKDEEVMIQRFAKNAMAPRTDNGAPIKVDNAVKVEMVATSTPVNIDGYKVFDIVTKYQQRDSVRLGREASR